MEFARKHGPFPAYIGSALHTVQRTSFAPSASMRHRACAQTVSICGFAQRSSFRASDRACSTRLLSQSRRWHGSVETLQPPYCNPPNKVSAANEIVASSSPAVPTLRIRAGRFLYAFYKFSRPHTIRGTILAVIAGVGRALWEYREFIDLALVPRALLGLIALLCGNAYIVGMNQIFDVDIDKVNKPFLPIASGEIDPKLGWIIVLACGVIGLSIVYLNFSPLIFSLFVLGTTIGVLYSIPPFRLKERPVAAAISIALVRGFLLNFGLYYATTEALKVPFAWNPPVIFLTVFMSLFALVIAITKDLPDIEGDKMYNVMTFAVQVGPRRLLDVAVGILLFTYTGAITLAFLFKNSFHQFFMIGSHLVLAAILLRRAQKVDAKKKESLVKFYSFLWKLFYAEFLLYPFM